MTIKDTLQELAAYNIWANNLLLGAVKELPEELHRKEVASSFNSLYKTIVHMWQAESVWWQRMKLLERIVEPMKTFTGTLPQAVEELKAQSKQWQDWINNAQQHQLDHVFEYSTFSGERFKQPIYQMLLHIFNHGSYHRGQIVTMLRQLGIEKIPQTDFIVWSRRKIS